MPTSALYLARAEAHEKLEEVTRHVNELEAERDKLQAIVASLDAYLPNAVDEVGTDVLPRADCVTIRDRTQPAWMSARDVLAVNGPYRMTVPRIHESLTKQGLLVAKDALRIAMLRRTDIFDNDGNGNYGLVAWSKPVMETHLHQDDAWQGFTALDNEKETAEAIS